VLDEDQIVTVAEVQGEADTLRAAIEADGWPDVDDLRGQFVFVLDDHAPSGTCTVACTPTPSTG
jgi:hypothetical protein